MPRRAAFNWFFTHTSNVIRVSCLSQSLGLNNIAGGGGGAAQEMTALGNREMEVHCIDGGGASLDPKRGR